MRFDLAIECITKKYAVFEGRASRAEYWTYILVLTVFGLVVGVIIGSAEPTLLPLFQIIGFLCFHGEENRGNTRRRRWREGKFDFDPPQSGFQNFWLCH